MINKLSTSIIIRLIILTLTFCFFLACSTMNMPISLQEFKEKEGETPSKASEDYWAIPEQYKKI